MNLWTGLSDWVLAFSNNMKYRDKKYFNDKDLYLFESSLRIFCSRVYYEGGYWWTVESLEYKATTLPCKKIKH